MNDALLWTQPSRLHVSGQLKVEPIEISGNGFESTVPYKSRKILNRTDAKFCPATKSECERVALEVCVRLEDAVCS